MLEPWDIVVIDEAHKLRNAHRSSNKMGQTLRRALDGSKKLLLLQHPTKLAHGIVWTFNHYRRSNLRR